MLAARNGDASAAAARQRDSTVAHLKEAARGFAAVDTGGTPRPEVWTLVEW
jgi:hypothetical protein